MHIDRLKLKNFRCYEDLEIDFAPTLTVLVGENGRGKTAIFDALSIALEPYLRSFGVQGNQILPSDVRHVPVYGENSHHILSMRSEYPLAVELAGYFHDEQFTSKRSLLADGSVQEEVATLSALGMRLASAEASAHVTLPALGYYGTSRIWVDSSLMQENLPSFEDKKVGYRECMEPSSSYNTFGKWYAQITKLLYEEQQVDDAYLTQMRAMYKAVSQAIDACLHSMGLHGLYYSLRLEEFVVNHVDMGELLVEHLSDGFRSALSMVADLAYRMVCLNPHLGERAVLDTPGVVLIDEIEMHLHPLWQQTVLVDLQRAFPKVQFIVNTHSPQVLSTVPAECIRVLEWQKNLPGVRHVDFSLGASSSQLLQDIQNVQPRVERLPIVQDLNRYLELVGEDKWDTAEAQELRKRLDAWSHGNEPALLRADMDIRLRQMRRKRS